MCWRSFGRRVALDPILLLLVAVRDGEEDAFATAGLDELPVPALDEEAAGELLDSVTRLAPEVRDRLLAEAAGNPLALIELPAAIDSDELIKATLPERLPLSTRLERAFAARMPELSRVARTLLLAAAANDGASATEALDASEIMEAAPVGRRSSR